MRGEMLNESQRRHLLTSVEYADELLSEIEEILNATASKSPFPKYQVDLKPAQGKMVQDYIARIRAQMLRVLEGQGIGPRGPQVGAIHSIRVQLAFVRIALTEIGPRYMRGFGEIPESAIADLNGLVAELNTLVDRLDVYLAQGLGQDLGARIERLQWAGDELDVLLRIERVVSAQGLVEFRPKLASILERLENKRFEIAVFGQVSSGKSSLLNHILDVDVLPVGVNPITAVPTRLISGPERRLTVAFADHRVERFELTALPDFVMEQRNPGNSKGVTKIVVELPAKRLSEGIVFVDTPGLGSLATSGAAETHAYLPQCDLGVVLISAGSTLGREDLATIQTLYEAGVPASILLSKADLLSEQDRKSALAYIAEQIQGRLGLTLKVLPVSVVDHAAASLDAWFEEQIAPLYERYQQLAGESVRRKIGALRESVEAALRSELGRAEGGTRPSDVEKLRRIEKEMRRTAGRIPEETSACLQIADEVEKLAPAAQREAAFRIVERWRQGQNAGPDIVTTALSETAAVEAGQLYERLDLIARETAGALQETARQLNVTEPPQEEDLVPALRGMPQLDFGGQVPLFMRSPLLSVSPALAMTLVQMRLKRLLGPEISEAFRSYSRVLNAWTRKTIAEIQSRFDLHADTYRAQLSRHIGSSEASPETAAAILSDLAAIRGERVNSGEGTMVREAHVS